MAAGAPDEIPPPAGAADGVGAGAPATPAKAIETLGAALADPANTKVGEEIDAALLQWPGEPALHLLKLRQLEQAGDTAARRAHLATARTLFPADAAFAVLAMGVALDDEDLAAAMAILRDEVWRPEVPEDLRSDALGVLFRAGQVPDEVVEALRALMSGRRDDRFILAELAAMDVQREQYDAALTRFAEAEALGLLPRRIEAARLRAMLKADRAHPALGAQITAALRTNRRNGRLHALKYDYHEERGEMEEARASLARARHLVPRDGSVALRYFRSQLASGELDEATRVLKFEIWPSRLSEYHRRQALGTFVWAWRDPAALEATLKGLLRWVPDDRFVLVKLASLATRRRRFAEAAAYLQQAEALGPLPSEAAPMRIDMLLLSGRFEDALALAKEQLAANPNRQDLLRRVNLTATMAARQEDITDSIVRAITAWPTEQDLLKRYNRGTLPLDLDRHLFEILRPLASSGEVSDQWRYQYAAACLRHGHTVEAWDTLQPLADLPKVGRLAKRLLLILGTLPPAEWDRRTRFVNDTMKDVEVVKVPGARATVVVFSGKDGGIGHLPFSHLDVLLCELPVNTIYLRDSNRRVFSRGIASLGPDEATSIAALRALCAGMDGAPVITLGASLGGGSAMRYAALMGARAAISLATPLRVTADSDDETGGRVVQRYLATLIPSEARDVVGLVEKSPDLRVFHVYGTGHPSDVTNAARLEPLPNVTLVPLDGCDDHFIISDLIVQGRLIPLLSRAIAATEGPDDGASV